MSPKTLVLVASSLLAGCHTTVAVCPPLVAYDQPFMTRLAAELEAAQVGSAMAKAVVDYRRLRDVIRACHASDHERR
jgi:hypothetical protein